MKYDVFISCKSEDYNIGRQVYEFLVNHRDVHLHVFMADKELRKQGNADYGNIIDEALDSSSDLIIVASNVEYLKKETSSYVYEEWHTFVEEIRSGRKKGNILTVFTKDVALEEVPIALRNRQSFPFTEFSGIIDYLSKKKEIDNSTSNEKTGQPLPLSLDDDIDVDLDYDDALDFMQDGELQEAIHSLIASFENGNGKTIPIFNRLLFLNFGTVDWDKETWMFLDNQTKSGYSFASLAYFYKYQLDKQSHSKAMEYLKQSLTDKENGYAYLCEGIAREKGIGIRPNLRSAMKRYEQAYKMGIAEASSYMAEMYLNGNSGLVIDKEKAIEILTEGENNNDARSCYVLGKLYARDAYLHDNWEIAIQHFEKAVDLHVSQAWIEIGKLQHFNRYSDTQHNDALSCYIQALKNGVKDAYAYIAQLYWEQGRQEDAILQAQKGEKAGNVLSLATLGKFYEEGLQNENSWIVDPTPNYPQAWHYYQKAFELGGRIDDAISMARLYVIDEYRPEEISWEMIENYLQQGAQIPIIEAIELMVKALKINGKEKDAVKYIKIGAESGSLSMMHEYGLHMQSADIGEALKYIEKAGEKRYRPSVEWLMDYYDTKIFNSKDLGKWMDIAVELGVVVSLDKYIPYLASTEEGREKIGPFLTKQYSDENPIPLYWLTKYSWTSRDNEDWLIHELRKHYKSIVKYHTDIYDLYANILIKNKCWEDYALLIKEVSEIDPIRGEYFTLLRDIPNISKDCFKETALHIRELGFDTTISIEWRERFWKLFDFCLAHIGHTKILVVDDVTSNVLLLKILLTNERHEVCTANNGKDCVSIAKSEKPGLILLDTEMPGMSGFETAEALLMDSETKDIPIIFLTPLNKPIDVVHGFQVGARDYIIKPFNKEELMTRVNRWAILSNLKDYIPQKLSSFSAKILIVDDVESNLTLLKILLAKEHFQVCTANSGTTCIEQARKEKPDLIILDVMMPDISGFDAAKVLKMDSETNNIPIIFLTALNTPFDLVRSFQLGADEFISKPFNKEELISRIYNIQGLHKTVSNFLDDKL